MFKKTKKGASKTKNAPRSSTTGTSSPYTSIEPKPFAIKVPINRYIRTKDGRVDDLNYKLKPIYLAMQYLTTRENVRIARLNSQIDPYIAVEALFF